MLHLRVGFTATTVTWATVHMWNRSFSHHNSHYERYEWYFSYILRFRYLNRQYLRTPLKTFYRNIFRHEFGIRCSIDNLDLEFDALFDTGTSHACLKQELIDKFSKQFQVLDTPPGYPLVYLVPTTIHLDSDSLSRYCMVYEGDENLIPPRIYTGDYSINFAQTNKKNFVIFNPKPKQPTIGEINLNYKTLFNKETWMTMPSGTLGFYFSIEFDTGSLFNVIDPATADKIEIERYPSAKPLNLDIPDLSSDHIQGYLVPIALPRGCFIYRACIRIRQIPHECHECCVCCTIPG